MDNPVHPNPSFETDEMNDVSAVINIRYHVMVKNKNDRRHKLSNWVVILCKMIREDVSDIVTCDQEPQVSEGLNHHVSGVRNSQEISVTGGNVQSQ